MLCERWLFQAILSKNTQDSREILMFKALWKVVVFILLGVCGTQALSSERDNSHPKTIRPKIAIIIDDLGTNWKNANKVLSLPWQVSASILPFTQYANKIALISKEQNRAILLHAPMEAEKNNQLLGPGALFLSMNPWHLLKQLRQDILDIPGVEGVNNHMGSKMTQELGTMRWVMGLLKWQGLYFIDSRTSDQSVAQQVAQSMGIENTRRNVFLDDDIDSVAINKQFDRLEQLATKNGSAVAIGHPHDETLRVLKNRLLGLEQSGYELVSIRDLVKI
ncbi:MAG: hypothetical protein COW84_01460 [Gammaproteobacteria bacterium CG22_combo_CG10-13_8_21_14_all_40_8]|nr:MAG: hypothetical protein COW84_01460 [Gammaproteobacteria bacterium CG22_combo_CG10-13_8_21_14_all_40_8]